MVSHGVLTNITWNNAGRLEKLKCLKVSRNCDLVISRIASSIFSHFSLTDVAFKFCWCFFISFFYRWLALLHHHTMCYMYNRLYMCSEVEAAYFCGDSSFKEGIPKPPWADGKVKSCLNSSVNCPSCPNIVGRNTSFNTSWIGSTYSWNDSMVHRKYVNFDLYPFASPM